MSASSFSRMVWTWAYWKVCNNLSKFLEKLLDSTYSSTAISPTFWNSSRKSEYGVLLSTDLLNSKIFFSDFGNIFLYFVIWSGNKIESPWNSHPENTNCWQTLNNWNIFYQCKIIFFFDFENSFNGNVSVRERHQRNEKVIFAKLKVSTRNRFTKNWGKIKFC